MPVLILDGGLGTSLEDLYNVKFDSSNPLWSSHLLVSNPDTLLACQKDFGLAGVDVLLTATYQFSIEGFSRTKTSDFPDGIPKSAIGLYLSRAIDIAEKAKVQDSTELALSLGPYGACMIPGQEYSGKYDNAHNSQEKLYQWHLERLKLFTEIKGLMGRVQYVAFETIPRLDEILAVRRAIYAATKGQVTHKFWISCVFPGEDYNLPDGSSIEKVIEAMIKPMEDGLTPWGIGLNCTKMHKLPQLIREFENGIKQIVPANIFQDVPSLVLYPDGTNGEVYNTTTQKWEKAEGQSSDDEQRIPWEVQLADLVKSSESRGCFNSFLVGGCCKASHIDIKRLGEQF